MSDPVVVLTRMALRPEPRRVTFAPIKPYGKDSPLFASGLMGPVLLKTVRYQILPSRFPPPE